MKKEVFLAILIGFGIGLLLTFVIYQTNKTLRTPEPFKSPKAEEPSATITPATSSHSLSLTSPLDQSISKEAKVMVSGVTSPFSWITILSEKKEELIQADKTGNFEAEISLISGENEIEVQSFFEGNKAIKTITIVYSTAEI